MRSFLLLCSALVVAAQAQHLPQHLVNDVLANPTDEELDAVRFVEGLEIEEGAYAPDPCADKHCEAGRACKTNEAGEAVCACVESCETETDPRRRVCSNHNETWMSDCALHRQRCLCVDDMPGCHEDMYAHVQIEYFGQCQQMPTCDQEELADFPRRMREWLFAVMRDMASRNLLARQYRHLEEEAELDDTRKWTNAVVWKWCDLDDHPKDRVVSRHELFPIRAPLLTLEHCISPFLDSCDPDDDHNVTLKEWASCLELNAEHADDMQELCEDIRVSRRGQ